MNRLQLVQRLNQEAASTGDTISTTLSQTGLIQRLIDWVDTAYQDIQAMRLDWDFLRTEFSFSMVVGTREYSKATLGYDDLSAWKVDDIRVYDDVSDEDYLIFEEYDTFKRIYLLGNYRALTGRPSSFSVKPDGSIIFDLLADDTYTINGEYYKIADVMDSTGATANTDEPIIPVPYQMAIVWRALMFYGAYEGADDVYSHGEKEFRRVLSQLELNQTPKQSFLSRPIA